MNEQVSIGFRRRLAFAFAGIFAALAVNGAWRAIASHNTVQLLVVLVAFGGIAAAYAAQALHREPVLLVDDEGVTDLRGGKVVHWHEIEAAHVAERRMGFDHYHRLVLTLGRGQALSLPLDQLTRKWTDVAGMIEGHLGRQVAIRREGNPLVRRSRAS